MLAAVSSFVDTGGWGQAELAYMERNAGYFESRL